MQIQSIKQNKINTTYYSNKKLTNNTNTNIYKQNPNETSDNFELKKDVSFSANCHSVEYYAKKYLYVDDFRSLLKDDIWETEFSGWQRFWESDKNCTKLRNKVNDVVAKINEMKSEIEKRDKREQQIKNHLERQREEKRRLKQKQAELEKRMKLEQIMKKRRNLELKRSKVEIEEKELGLDKELVQDQKLSIYTEILQPEFIKKAQLEKAEKNKNIGVFPNGIMVSGLDKKVSDELIQWTVKKSGCEFRKIDFEKLTEENALKTLIEQAKEAQQNGQRTLIYIENFDKYTQNSPKNENIIPKLKAFLSSCAEKYKCTIIINVKDPNELAPEIKADQRFPIKINEIY